MITQIAGNENILHVYSDKHSIQAIIDDLRDDFFRVGNVITLPCSGKDCVIGKAGHISNGKRSHRRLIKDGFYTRNLIHVCKRIENNETVYHFYTEKVKVQRVRSDSGHCHALLLDFIVPYESFTYAAAIAIEELYGKSGMESLEDFSLSLSGINPTVKTLEKLINWVRQFLGIIGVSLAPEGDGPDAERKAFERAAKEIRKNFAEIFRKAISALKRTLFQWRVPKHSAHMTGRPIWESV